VITTHSPEIKLFHRSGRGFPPFFVSVLFTAPVWVAPPVPSLLSVFVRLSTTRSGDPTEFALCFFFPPSILCPCVPRPSVLWFSPHLCFSRKKKHLPPQHIALPKRSFSLGSALIFPEFRSYCTLSPRTPVLHSETVFAVNIKAGTLFLYACSRVIPLVFPRSGSLFLLSSSYTPNQVRRLFFFFPQICGATLCDSSLLSFCGQTCRFSAPFPFSRFLVLVARRMICLSGDLFVSVADPFVTLAGSGTCLSSPRYKQVQFSPKFSLLDSPLDLHWRLYFFRFLTGC